MSLLTPRTKLPYPRENEDPWFSKFEDYANAVDAELYAQRENANSVIMGGGILSWDASTGTLTWTATLMVASTPTGFVWTLAAGSAIIADGQVAYITINRNPTANTAATLTVGNTVPLSGVSNGDRLLLCLRSGSTLYFRDGKVIQDGVSRSLFGVGSSVEIPMGTYEARPLTPSGTFSDLEVWYWTDKTFPAGTGQGSAAWTIEAYRDTTWELPFFQHNQNDKMNIAAQMPHEWAGTGVSFHLHTIPMAAVGGNVYWSGYGYFTKVGEVIPAVASWTPITTTQTIAAGDQYKHTIAPIVSVAAPATPGHSDTLAIVLSRLGNDVLDTYSTNKDHGIGAANLGLISYDVHYQHLLEGSFNLYTNRVVVNPSKATFSKESFPGNVFLILDVRSVGGNECEFQLYDETGAAAVAGTTVTTTSTSYERKVIGPLTLGAGLRKYKVQCRYTGTADEPVLAQALWRVA